ncbi:hypothetical protein [Kribbella sp. VKM Ac-2571]|uniref:hypothetical protein n=1 Tax=Kribbella sp. VKM Ac-2571 TaxID=2512222 RepID=UPI00105E5BDF|nr:hypothetical protein [Kribbella sp. VKM Ac-2571]
MPKEPRGDRPTRYRLLDRLRDGHAGRRDGRRDAAVPAYRSPHPDGQPTDWLARNQHQLLAGCQYEYTSAHRDAEGLLEQLATARADATQARAELTEATLRWQANLDEPPLEALQRRGPAELGDSPETIADRRRAEHLRRLAALETACEQARARVNTAETTAASCTTRIVARFANATDLSRELLELHEQRAAHYRAAYRRTLRRAEPAAEPGHPLTTTPPLRIPQWASEPCPWLPDEQHNEATTVTVRSIR